MIEFAIYKKLKEDFSSNVFYGTAEEEITSAFIIQNSVDVNADPQLPCDEFGEAGTITIQWTVYATDWFKVDKLSKELNEYLYNINLLTFEEKEYIINSKITNAKSNNNVIEGGLTYGQLTMTFNHTRKK